VRFVGYPRAALKVIAWQSWEDCGYRGEGMILQNNRGSKKGKRHKKKGGGARPKVGPRLDHETDF